MWQLPLLGSLGAGIRGAANVAAGGGGGCLRLPARDLRADWLQTTTSDPPCEPVLHPYFIATSHPPTPTHHMQLGR